MASSNWFGSMWPSDLPEDVDREDVKEIKAMQEALMNTKYPPFTPETVSTMSKDYYLPALKVLEMDKNGKFFSPSQTGEWVGNELAAECQAGGASGRWAIRIMNPYGADGITAPDKHKAPHENCDCGIYGSVHMEEVRGYLEQESRMKSTNSMYFGSWQSGPPQILEEKKRVLCIIEPSEGAEVIVCRKGWKASKAFISEIVGETISIAEASQLLSMAWQRNIDVRRVFHEDR